MYDTAGQWLYVDGQRQPDEGYFQARGPRPVHRYDLVIGCSQPSPPSQGPGTSFDGLIDEPMVFDRILSPKEVAFLYAFANAR
jgi:hypothetical protein